MPRYENDPTKIATSIEVFPKDDYELIVGEPKAFERTNQQGKTSYGVRYRCTVASGPYQGKPFVKTCYMHTEGGEGMSKQFIMAVLGYGRGRSEEQRFDSDYAGKDWSFDTDSGAAGDMWRELSGKRVIANLEQSIGQNGDEQQKENGYRPLSAA